MVYRAVDVAFQYLKPLVALLVVVPLLAGGVSYALGRSDTVTARVWADRPVFTPDFTSDLYTSTDSPAQVESALMTEMIGTDAFATNVETTIAPDFASWPTDRQDQAFANLRSAVSVAPEGQHLFVVSYTTTHPTYGISVLQAILKNYATAVTDLESSQVGAAAGTLQSSLDAAQQAMNQAISDVQSYQARQHLSDQQAQHDPNYSTMYAQARAKTDSYLNLLAQVEAANASQQAVPKEQAAMFHIVDPPAVVPQALIGAKTPGLRQAGTALGAVAALEALLVYVVARRDPTIRSGEDIRRALGLKSLGSVPVLESR